MSLAAMAASRSSAVAIPSINPRVGRLPRPFICSARLLALRDTGRKIATHDMSQLPRIITFPCRRVTRVELRFDTHHTCSFDRRSVKPIRVARGSDGRTVNHCESRTDARYTVTPALVTTSAQLVAKPRTAAMCVKASACALSEQRSHPDFPGITDPSPRSNSNQNSRNCSRVIWWSSGDTFLSSQGASLTHPFLAMLPP